ncbi:hypothetical protein THASP1DRAFT_25502 [Thamnocephalis sphaerospora]|uniref:F-box domain-containing protein n=1 Tax=Thamnocephalis sphaerospora TaxID=78915 RepID=A0A4P9XK01_9FUNG|nr:hypothetical protein THASP1DRAFT_25502 [Thamnocephalis sphaerospora]|eukprot:RKP06118.1 hypothetical protein THASP1DRAFT_25502 [Thamnocephalis sphaerospora]
MRHIPNEVLDRIIEASHDEAALVSLSCTSKRLRVRVSHRQKLWRGRFEQQFPQRDDKEREWLCQYKRTYQAKTYVSNAAEGLPSQPDDSPLDWFDAYCKRRATEYRWRHGQYAVNRLVDVADACPRGVRLQSIPYAPRRSSPDKAVVASQWQLISQVQPTWLLESLCWDGIDVENREIWDMWRSDDYLVIQTMNTSNHSVRRNALHVWHFAALDVPPQTIRTKSGWIHDVSVREHWLIYRWEPSTLFKQHFICVYNLAKGSYCSDARDDLAYCILRTTADSVYIAWIESDRDSYSYIAVTYNMWRIAPGQAAPFQWQSSKKTEMSDGASTITPRRIDDNRFIMSANYDFEPNPGLPPPLVLVELVDGKTGTVMEEKWSRTMRISRLQPIGSRNLLMVEQGRKTVLLSLSDGSVVHRMHYVHLDCWRISGLYPLNDQWAKMADDETWADPKTDVSLSVHNATQVFLPTAILYGTNGALTVVDYMGYSRR